MPHPKERLCSRTHAQTLRWTAGRYDTSSSFSAKPGPYPGHKSPALPAFPSLIRPPMPPFPPEVNIFDFYIILTFFKDQDANKENGWASQQTTCLVHSVSTTFSKEL